MASDFQNCGLGCWGDRSQISRAVSRSPTGPFKKVEVIAGAEHTNPTLNKVPGGPYVIVSAGNGTFPKKTHGLSAKVGDPPEAGLITMLYSDKITGPWKPRPGPQLILAPGPSDTWDAFVTNPSVYFYPNGSALMAYRGGPCLTDPQHNGTCGRPGVPNSPHVAFAYAPRWDAEFTRLSSQPAWTERTEDPGIFRDVGVSNHSFGRNHSRCLSFSFSLFLSFSLFDGRAAESIRREAISTA